MNKNITVSIPEDLLELVDEAKGDVPRSKWVCRTIEYRLKQAKEKGGRS